MSSLFDLFGSYWLEVAPILILPWAVATVALLFFAASRGWRALSLWQRRYLMAAGTVLPLFVYFVLLHWSESVDSASYLYISWLMVLITLAALIEWAGIAIGLMLLVKTGSAVVEEIKKILKENL